jgi:hypothetical protein
VQYYAQFFPFFVPFFIGCTLPIFTHANEKHVHFVRETIRTTAQYFFPMWLL